MSRRDILITWNSLYECYQIRLTNSLSLVRDGMTIVEARNFRRRLIRHGHRAIEYAD